MVLPAGVTLYLARHGETEANKSHRFSGKRDTPLTENGLIQCHAVGEILKREAGMRPALHFVSSPLFRARLTMEIVLQVLGLPQDAYETEPRIAEIDLGIWDQLTEEEARGLDPALYDARATDKWNVRVPGGENYQEVAARAEAWVRSISSDMFAVSHGALTRILRGLFLGLDWHGMSGLDEPQGVVFRIRGSDVTRLDP
ncbi:MAG TPA: histidine phosphatase family protein [Rhizomicrobium sp.]|nr:histidine phosphatase family protein [Rhizomicrobium sp.]